VRGFDGSVALVTGAAHGIGAGIARRLAGLGTRVVLADVDTAAGTALAGELRGRFVACDVGRYPDSQRVVTEAVRTYGGVDIVALNAGVTTGFGLGEDFNPERYRRAMAINLDGVVYGVHAARPALLARGGGDIVATASLAAVAPVPQDPVYSANKAAVVALARALGPAWAADWVRVNALCPGYADTAIVDPFRSVLADQGIPLLTVDEVVDAFLAVLEARRTGECWYVQPGRPAEPFRFPRVPGTRPALTSQEG
jgi:NAD(P)-dependent dehydrogenase (short-subunit alcohol dehydrogenase family)